MKFENLNLTALKYYLDAYEKQSITQSSLINNVSRPAVSQSILRLEEWYGKKLLKHEKRNFEATPEGKNFYLIGKKITEDIKKSFNRNTLKKDTELKIAISISVLDYLYQQIAPHLKSSINPLVKIAKTHELFELLKTQQVNLGFTVNTGQKNFFNSHTISSGFFKVLSQSKKSTDCLITTEKRPEVLAFKKYCKQHKIIFKNTIEVESWSAALKLAQMNLGCCLVPDFLSSAHLIDMPLPLFRYKYEIQMLHNKKKELSAVENSLLQSFL